MYIYKECPHTPFLLPLRSTFVDEWKRNSLPRIEKMLPWSPAKPAAPFVDFFINPPKWIWAKPSYPQSQG